MKTMTQMQAELLEKATWDGSYPKAVHMIPGIIVLARNAEHEERLMRSNLRGLIIGITFAVAFTILLF